jgi:hypothetical protein
MMGSPQDLNRRGTRHGCKNSMKKMAQKNGTKKWREKMAR